MNQATTLTAGAFLTVSLVAGLVFLLGDSGQTQEADATVAAEESFIDLGTISMANGKVEHFYQLKNEGGQPVELGELYTSCMCTEAQAIYADGQTSRVAGMRGHGSPARLSRTLQPGEPLQIKAVFDPAAHGPQGVGPVSRSIYLQTNSRQTPLVELTFEAVVTR